MKIFMFVVIPVVFIFLYCINLDKRDRFFQINWDLHLIIALLNLISIVVSFIVIWTLMNKYHKFEFETNKLSLLLFTFIPVFIMLIELVRNYFSDPATLSDSWQQICVWEKD